VREHLLKADLIVAQFPGSDVTIALTCVGARRMAFYVATLTNKR